jgi:hypothetical protein
VSVPIAARSWRVSSVVRTGVLPRLIDDVFRSPDRVRGVKRHDLAGHQPVEQHPQRRVLLRARLGVRLLVLINIGGDDGGAEERGLSGSAFYISRAREISCAARRSICSKSLATKCQLIARMYEPCTTAD